MSITERLIDNIDISKLSPMMKHYVSIKNEHPNEICFYRLGDFYEMFFDDAITVSRELELTLTGKECGLEDKAPMCGVPFKSSEMYLTRLVEKGYRVAVVDQLEDAKNSIGLVQRGITRVISPGTITDLETLDKTKNNYLMSIIKSQNEYYISYIDITTGELFMVLIDGIKQLAENLLMIHPSEILLTNDFCDKNLIKFLNQENFYISYEDYHFSNLSDTHNKLLRYFKSNIIKRISKSAHFMASLELLINYIYKFRDEKLEHIGNINFVNLNKYIYMNAGTRENLELLFNSHDNTKNHSLLKVIDKTVTASGARLLRKNLELPLVDRELIEYRLSIIDEIKNNLFLMENLKECLLKVYDIERLIGKLSYNRANARDLVALKNSLKVLPAIKSLLENTDSEILKSFAKNIKNFSHLTNELDIAIDEDAPLSVTEGGIILEGYSSKLDELRNASDIGKNKLIQYEISEKEKTGIKKLKVVYRKNNGYFIEITNSFKEQVPDYYIRRQTLKNAERYSTNELNEISDLILTGKEKSYELEYEIFQFLRNKISKETLELMEVSHIIAELDFYLSGSYLANDNNYVKPIFSSDGIISIKEARHPIVELTEEFFIANDINFGTKEDRIRIITGPNMAGKSTYMRELALIVIMAQIGYFVPASYAKLPIIDKLFTRIGAGDKLSRGESTFMVEMKEMSEILNNATKNSLLILDEVGRGTSTDDGLSIAYSIIEYIASTTKAKTLFATHYHELVELSKKINCISSYKVDIEEKDGELIFLRKVVEGSSNRSYGIEVAQLSGLPKEVIDRAKDLLSKFSSTRTFDDNANYYSNFLKDFLIMELKDINMDEDIDILKEKIRNLKNKALDL